MTMGKRCLAMVVYNPVEATAEQQRAAKRPRPSPSAEEAAAVVPYNAADAAQPLDAQPLNAVPWEQSQSQPQPGAKAPPPPPAPPLSALRAEPPCLRNHLLQVLRLRGDLQMHFIDVKKVTLTDLDSHQNRLRIPTKGVLERLRPLLTYEELDAANLLYDPEPRAKKPKQLPGQDGSSQLQQPPAGEKMKKKTGKVHGGLPVKLVNLAAGASWELQLSRWESSHGTIVKGERYIDFIRECSFNVNDEVEIWAFKQHRYRYFGVTMCEDSILHLFIVKKDDAPTTCRYCPHPVNQAT